MKNLYKNIIKNKNIHFIPSKYIIPERKPNDKYDYFTNIKRKRNIEYEDLNINREERDYYTQTYTEEQKTESKPVVNILKKEYDTDIYSTKFNFYNTPEIHIKNIEKINKIENTKDKIFNINKNKIYVDLIDFLLNISDYLNIYLKFLNINIFKKNVNINNNILYNTNIIPIYINKEQNKKKIILFNKGRIETNILNNSNIFSTALVIIKKINEYYIYFNYIYDNILKIGKSVDFIKYNIKNIIEGFNFIGSKEIFIFYKYYLEIYIMFYIIYYIENNINEEILYDVFIKSKNINKYTELMHMDEDTNNNIYNNILNLLSIKKKINFDIIEYIFSDYCNIDNLFLNKINYINNYIKSVININYNNEKIIKNLLNVAFFLKTLKIKKYMNENFIYYSKIFIDDSKIDLQDLFFVIRKLLISLIKKTSLSSCIQLKISNIFKFIDKYKSKNIEVIDPFKNEIFNTSFDSTYDFQRQFAAQAYNLNESILFLNNNNNELNNILKNVSNDFNNIIKQQENLINSYKTLDIDFYNIKDQINNYKPLKKTIDNIENLKIDNIESINIGNENIDRKYIKYINDNNKEIKDDKTQIKEVKYIYLDNDVLKNEVNKLKTKLNEKEKKIEEIKQKKKEEIESIKEKYNEIIKNKEASIEEKQNIIEQYQNLPKEEYYNVTKEELETINEIKNLKAKIDLFNKNTQNEQNIFLSSLDDISVKLKNNENKINIRDFEGNLNYIRTTNKQNMEEIKKFNKNIIKSFDKVLLNVFSKNNEATSNLSSITDIYNDVIESLQEAFKLQSDNFSKELEIVKSNNEQEINTMKINNKNLLTKITEKEQELNNLKTEKELKINDYKKKLTEYELKVHELEKKISYSDNKYKEVFANMNVNKVNVIEIDLKNKEKKIKELLSNIKKIQLQNDNYKESLKKETSNVKDLERNILALKKEREDYEKTEITNKMIIDNLTNRINNYKNEFDTIKFEKDQLNKQNIELNFQIQQIKEENFTLTFKIQGYEQKINSYNNEIDSIKKKMEDSMKKSEMKMKQLIEENENNNKKKADYIYEEQNRLIKESNEEIKKLTIEYNEKIEKQRREFEQKIAEIEKSNITNDKTEFNNLKKNTEARINALENQKKIELAKLENENNLLLNKLKILTDKYELILQNQKDNENKLDETQKELTEKYINEINKIKNEYTTMIIDKENEINKLKNENVEKARLEVENLTQANEIAELKKCVNNYEKNASILYDKISELKADSKNKESNYNMNILYYEQEINKLNILNNYLTKISKNSQENYEKMKDFMNRTSEEYIKKMGEIDNECKEKDLEIRIKMDEINNLMMNEQKLIGNNQVLNSLISRLKQNMERFDGENKLLTKNLVFQKEISKNIETLKEQELQNFQKNIAKFYETEKIMMETEYNEMVNQKAQILASKQIDEKMYNFQKIAEERFINLENNYMASIEENFNTFKQTHDDTVKMYENEYKNMYEYQNKIVGEKNNLLTNLNSLYSLLASEKTGRSKTNIMNEALEAQNKNFQDTAQKLSSLNQELYNKNNSTANFYDNVFKDIQTKHNNMINDLNDELEKQQKMNKEAIDEQNRLGGEYFQSKMDLEYEENVRKREKSKMQFEHELEVKDYEATLSKAKQMEEMTQRIIDEQNIENQSLKANIMQYEDNKLENQKKMDNLKVHNYELNQINNRNKQTIENNEEEKQKLRERVKNYGKQIKNLKKKIAYLTIDEERRQQNEEKAYGEHQITNNEIDFLINNGGTVLTNTRELVIKFETRDHLDDKTLSLKYKKRRFLKYFYGYSYLFLRNKDTFIRYSKKVSRTENKQAVYVKKEYPYSEVIKMNISNYMLSMFKENMKEYVKNNKLNGIGSNVRLKELISEQDILEALDKKDVIVDIQNNEEVFNELEKQNVIDKNVEVNEISEMIESSKEKTNEMMKRKEIEFQINPQYAQRTNFMRMKKMNEGSKNKNNLKNFVLKCIKSGKMKMYDPISYTNRLKEEQFSINQKINKNNEMTSRKAFENFMNKNIALQYIGQTPETYRKNVAKNGYEINLNDDGEIAQQNGQISYTGHLDQNDRLVPAVNDFWIEWFNEHGLGNNPDGRFYEQFQREWQQQNMAPDELYGENYNQQNYNYNEERHDEKKYEENYARPETVIVDPTIGFKGDRITDKLQGKGFESDLEYDDNDDLNASFIALLKKSVDANGNNVANRMNEPFKRKLKISHN